MKFNWHCAITGGLLSLSDRHNLWGVLILPAILNLSIALVVLVFAVKSSGQVVDWFLKNFHANTVDDAFHRFLESMILLFLRGMVFLLYLKIYRYMVLFLTAPLLAFVSEKIQSLDLHTGEHIAPIRYFREFTRGMRLAIRNFFFDLGFTLIVLFVTFLVTWLIPLAPFLILLVESYYMGYAMIDYRNEYLKMPMKASRELVNQHMGLTIGNGLLLNLSLFIPLLGILFAPVFALIAAGLSMNYVEKRKSILSPDDHSGLTVAR